MGEPLSVKRKKSPCALANLNGDKLKVNDKGGNPIEIAAVVVWKVQDTFAACFDVVNYADFVKVQSETAVRHLASAYPYDSWEEGDDRAISPSRQHRRGLRRPREGTARAPRQSGNQS